MATRLTWLGHASWLMNIDGVRVLIDPFMSGSPTASVKADELVVEYILVSHGHFDHVADAADIARRCNATIVSNFEIATWFSSQHGIAQTLGMNLGGAVTLPFGKLKLTLAFHSSQLPDGSYGGNPVGFLISTARERIYFACDTALFGDMQLIGNVGLDIAVLPIGDLFTMGPDDSIEAIKLLRPKHVIPSHFNTWPPIAQDADGWAERVRAETAAEPVVLMPGESFDVS